jgi:hypothetical protein
MQGLDVSVRMTRTTGEHEFHVRVQILEGIDQQMAVLFRRESAQEKDVIVRGKTPVAELTRHRPRRQYVYGVRFREPIKRVALPSECRISQATRFDGLCDGSARETVGAGLLLCLRALRHRNRGGWRSRRFRCSWRPSGFLGGEDHGELQGEHARNSQNNVLDQYIHLRTLTVALNGESNSSNG